MKRANKQKSAAIEPKEKLSKADPEFYSKIAKLAGKKLKKKRGKKYFSDLAKKSHPRASYNGGRPKKAISAPQNQRKSTTA